MARYAALGSASHSRFATRVNLEDVVAAAKEAVAAGDLVMAESLREFALCSQRGAGPFSGEITIQLRDGRRFNLADARRHIRAVKATPIGRDVAMIRAALEKIKQSEQLSVMHDAVVAAYQPKRPRKR